VQTIEKTTVLPAPAERVWRAVHDPLVLKHILEPLIEINPIEPKSFPDEYVPGTYVLGLKLFGRVPAGRQAMRIDHPAPEPGEALPRYVLRDEGSGDIVRMWSHRIAIVPFGDVRCQYTDRITIEAGLLTPFIALFARTLVAHRQKRLTLLAGAGFRVAS
jgi:hypothetical protein